MSVKDVRVLVEVVVPLCLVPVDSHVFPAHLWVKKCNSEVSIEI